ncbi:GNAT family N-acetyltransferase [Clostridium sp. NSJ-145]|uniref:GNAT family N-acetyltransferase n=1 Tax=Clostridium sp. NSJ-145 TaxID=2897777 RepID=UPI001E408451|nr:GNAT family N-acetyltransferase [Clostridium sp. NSJ-145]MCD2502116.1 GNAT family N-acetyltransferase [Clostridium sp. NSJ-145]
MSNYVEVKGKKYIYEKNYKENERLRKSFNELANRTFGIDFEQWYQEGYWGDSYITYSLIDNGEVVSNVSVSIMEFDFKGEKKIYIQIGTVMTDERYRNKGLARYLMETVIEEWKDKCDLIYLFANDSAINFYPKFNFIEAYEYEYSIGCFTIDEESRVRKINMEDSNDKEIFKNIIENTVLFSQFAVLNNKNLVMFYCNSFMKENIYYVEDYDAIVIAEKSDEIIYILEVFGTKNIDLESIINKIVNKNTKKVVLGFTPFNTVLYDEKILKEEDTTLFVMKDKDNPLEFNNIMFPVLSHA